MKEEKTNTPIIVANTQWDLPETLVKDVKAERMINGLIDMATGGKLDYKDLVGDAEVVVDLNPVAISINPFIIRSAFTSFTKVSGKSH